MNSPTKNIRGGRTRLASRNAELRRRLWQDAGLGESASGTGGRASSGRERFAATMR